MRIKIQKNARLVLIAIAALSGCYRPAEPNIGREMRDSYQTVSKLYGYVWDDALFDDPKSDRKISKMLKHLSENFHRVESGAPNQFLEPGFNTILTVQQEYLSDISNRFEAGSKDYAKWRLRSLSQNCIACHSRFNAPIDFLGTPPALKEGSVEAELATAQFLFASRQFDQASDHLLALARNLGSLESGSADALRALQLWLAIEVRVKNRYKPAADSLEKLLSEGRFSYVEKDAVRSWVTELRQLQAMAPIGAQDLSLAEKLLAPVREAKSIAEDNAHLVYTLQATSILHHVLAGKGSMVNLEKPTYLLAFAYAHLPVQAFEGLDELFLEQCIRAFPGSPEAESAFELYADLVEFRSSGSGGMHLYENQVNKLQELRKLADGQTL